MLSVTVLLVLTSLAAQCYGHGRMIKPPSRNAMWRFKEFEGRVAINYNDNEQNCGGFATQWKLNKGKCGVCGDPYNSKKQEHIHPGKYASGIIGYQYTQGQQIEIHIDITSNHQGWFEFRVADIGNPPITQTKLDANLLKIVGAKGHPHRYEIPARSFNQVFKVFAILPSDLVCNHCVMQWWWKTGNSWGCDSTGCGMGKGSQETFVNCADIEILPKGTKPSPTKRSTKGVPTTSPKVTVATNPMGQNCRAIGPWKDNPSIKAWCEQSCPLHCPATHCSCS